MADTIKLMAGNRDGMPTLPDRTPAFVRDEKALYIGTESGNLKLCDADTIQDVQTLKDSITTVEDSIRQLSADKLSASPAAALAELGADATLEAVVSAYNALIVALKAGGIMENG